MKKIILFFLFIVILSFFTGCGSIKEKDVLGQYYYTTTTNVSDSKGSPIMVVYVITLSKEEKDENYKFTQDLYTIGRKGHHEEVAAGTWNEKTKTLTIGQLKPFVYEESSKNLIWGGDHLIPVTDRTKKDLEKAIKATENQSLY